MTGKLMMLAGGIVEPGGGHPGSVSAYVVLSAAPASRLFRVRGPSNEAEVTELPSATTIDLQRFKRELEEDLQPALAQLRALGGAAAIAMPKADWVCGIVRDHLKKEGLDVG
jgi:hypothetical protein